MTVLSDFPCMKPRTLGMTQVVHSLDLHGGWAGTQALLPDQWEQPFLMSSCRRLGRARPGVECRQDVCSRGVWMGPPAVTQPSSAAPSPLSSPTSSWASSILTGITGQGTSGHREPLGSAWAQQGARGGEGTRCQLGGISWLPMEQTPSGNFRG